MKKKRFVKYSSRVVLVFAIIMILAIIFALASTAGAEKKETGAKQAVIELCLANIWLAEKVEVLLAFHKLAAFKVYDEVSGQTVAVPNADFFRLILAQVRLGGDGVKYDELSLEMADYNRVLRTAQRRLSMKFC